MKLEKITLLYEGVHSKTDGTSRFIAPMVFLVGNENTYRFEVKQS